MKDEDILLNVTGCVTVVDGRIAEPFAINHALRILICKLRRRSMGRNDE